MGPSSIRLLHFQQKCETRSLLGPLLQQYEPGSLLNHNATTVTSDHITTAMTLDNTDAFDICYPLVCPTEVIARHLT
jgi:hypothetical protein